jgi:hypothetical protein
MSKILKDFERYWWLSAWSFWGWQVRFSSDIFILMAVAISFAVSGYLWFSGQREEGLFTAIWVPSILCFGIYFELIVLRSPKS